MVISKLPKATNKKPVRSSFLRPILSTRNNLEKKQMPNHEISQSISFCLKKTKQNKTFSRKKCFGVSECQCEYRRIDRILPEKLAAFTNITICVPKSHTALECCNTHRHNGECHVGSSHSKCQIFGFFKFGLGKYFRWIIYDLKMK